METTQQVESPKFYQEHVFPVLFGQVEYPGLPYAEIASAIIKRTASPYYDDNDGSYNVPISFNEDEDFHPFREQIGSRVLTVLNAFAKTHQFEFTIEKVLLTSTGFVVPFGGRVERKFGRAGATFTIIWTLTGEGTPMLLYNPLRAMKQAQPSLVASATGSAHTSDCLQFGKMPGNLYIFPAYLEYGVEVNQTDNEKVFFEFTAALIE